MRERKHVRRRQKHADRPETREEMTLMTAFDLVVSKETGQRFTRNEERAFEQIHEVVRRCTRSLVEPGDEGLFERTDVTHNAMMKLMGYGGEWRPKYPGQVYNFIRKTVFRERNGYFKRITRNRDRATITGTLVRDAATENREFRKHLRDLLRDCTILPEETTMKTLDDALWNAIEKDYLPEIISARWLDNYLESLDELRRIQRGELTVDDLVDEEAGPNALPGDEKRARHAIHKRHSRLREKLTTVACERRDELGLTDADLQLLALAARALEMRKQKTDWATI